MLQNSTVNSEQQCLLSCGPAHMQSAKMQLAGGTACMQAAGAVPELLVAGRAPVNAMSGEVAGAGADACRSGGDGGLGPAPVAASVSDLYKTPGTSEGVLAEDMLANDVPRESSIWTMETGCVEGEAFEHRQGSTAARLPTGSSLACPSDDHTQEVMQRRDRSVRTCQHAAEEASRPTPRGCRPRAPSRLGCRRPCAPAPAAQTAPAAAAPSRSSVCAAPLQTLVSWHMVS